jgi:hypothetical protein
MSLDRNLNAYIGKVSDLFFFLSLAENISLAKVRSSGLAIALMKLHSIVVLFSSFL